MATRGRPPKTTEAKDKAPAKKATTKPVVKAQPEPKKPVKLVKKKVFENTVQKKVKTPKPTIQNKTIISRMADSITNTFS